MMMRHANLIILAIVAVGPILGIGAAIAAERRAQTSGEPPAVTVPYDWTGCYVGGYVGGTTQSREVNAWDPVSAGGTFPAGTHYNPAASPAGGAFDNQNGNFNYNFRPGAIGGGTIGCNWQGASPLVFGIEGEGGYMKLSASTVDPYSRGTSSDTLSTTRIGDWSAAVTGRVGYAWDRVLVYLKSGVGFADISSSLIDACAAAPCSAALLTSTGSSHQPFWVGGAGIEYALNSDWSIKGEVLVLGMYKTYAVCGPGAGAAAGSTFCGKYSVEGAHTFKIGANYHFNAPIAARY
jgi:outer membrane immunogenic protein